MKSLTKLLKHRKLWFITALIISDGAFFSFTNPLSAPSSMLIIGFVLVSLTLFSLTYALIGLLNQAGFALGAAYRKAALGCTGLITMLIALQSIGQLNARDVVVTLPFGIIAYVYLTYGKTPTEKLEL